MDQARIIAIQAALDTDAAKEIYKAAGIAPSELDTIFELAIASAASSPGVPGVRLTYPNGETQILTQAEWQRVPADILATVSVEILTPREFNEAIKGSIG